MRCCDCSCRVKTKPLGVVLVIRWSSHQDPLLAKRWLFKWQTQVVIWATITSIFRYRVVVLVILLKDVLDSFQDHIHGVHSMVVSVSGQIVLSYHQFFNLDVTGVLTGFRMQTIHRLVLNKWLVHQFWQTKLNALDAKQMKRTVIHEHLLFPLRSSFEIFS